MSRFYRSIRNGDVGEVVLAHCSNSKGVCGILGHNPSISLSFQSDVHTAPTKAMSPTPVKAFLIKNGWRARWRAAPGRLRES